MDLAKCVLFGNATLDYFSQALEYTLKVRSAYPSASLFIYGLAGTRTALPGLKPKSRCRTPKEDLYNRRSVSISSPFAIPFVTYCFLFQCTRFLWQWKTKASEQGLRSSVCLSYRHWR